MPGPPIIVDDVWKKFRRGERLDSLRDLVPTLSSAIFSKKRRAELRGTEFWALRGISFQVNAGEALGIIGPNGAGKSTMLRLLSRILRPTSGHVSVRGRIGSLIEVAAAFHPDLTGRENIFMQGAILGMARAEVQGKLDAIVEFAGVSDFVDTPVKRYSSGMHARLGFAVAAHLDPDVLIIDEVLSVGDMAFQQKCVDRMLQFKAQGVAIAFVSHNLQAVAALCDRAAYLQTEVRAEGPVREVLESYVTAAKWSGDANPTAHSAIVAAELSDADGHRVDVIAPHRVLKLRVTYRAAVDTADLTFGFVLRRTTDELTVYDGNVHGDDIGVMRLTRSHEVTLEFQFYAHLTRGHYDVECHLLHNPTRRFLARLRPAAVFAVDESRTYGGVADLELHVERIDDSAL
jgi:lipopolysaccharide transport system ATP-binding protein